MESKQGESESTEADKASDEPVEMKPEIVVKMEIPDEEYIPSSPTESNVVPILVGDLISQVSGDEFGHPQVIIKEEITDEDIPQSSASMGNMQLIQPKIESDHEDYEEINEIPSLIESVEPVDDRMEVSSTIDENKESKMEIDEPPIAEAKESTSKTPAPTPKTAEPTSSTSEPPITKEPHEKKRVEVESKSDRRYKGSSGSERKSSSRDDDRKSSSKDSRGRKEMSKADRHTQRVVESKIKEISRKIERAESKTHSKSSDSKRSSVFKEPKIEIVDDYQSGPTSSHSKHSDRSDEPSSSRSSDYSRRHSSSSSRKTDDKRYSSTRSSRDSRSSRGESSSKSSSSRPAPAPASESANKDVVIIGTKTTKYRVSHDLLQNMIQAKQYPENGKRVNSLDYSPDGWQLITATEDDSIYLYDLRTGKRIKSINSKKYGAGNIRFSPKENCVLHSSTKIDNTIRHLSLSDNKYLRYFTGHTDRVTGLDVSQKDTFVSTSLDKSVRVWDLRSQTAIGYMPLPSSAKAAFDPDGILFGVVFENYVKLFDMRTYEKGPFMSVTIDPIAASKGKLEPCEYTAMRFSSNGKYILLGTDKNYLLLLDAFTGGIHRILRGHINPEGVPLEPSFSPCSKFVFCGSGDKKIYAWGTERGELVTTLNTIHEKTPHIVEFSQKHCAIASADNKVVLWSLAAAFRIPKNQVNPELVKKQRSK